MRNGKEVAIRPVRDDEWDIAQTVINAAFDTFIHGRTGVSNLQHRFYMHRAQYSDVALVAEAEDGSISGVTFGTLWGKCAWFGPLAVHPDQWDQGLGKHLLEHVFAAFDNAGATHVELFTFTNSLKHHHLYSSFGCHPAFLTYIMEYPLQPTTTSTSPSSPPSSDSIPLPDEQFTFLRYSALAQLQQQEVLQGCRRITAAMHADLDCSKELTAVAEHQLGESLLVQSAAGAVEAFVVLHHGERTEAAKGVGFIKVAAASSQAALRAAVLYALQYCQQQGLEKVDVGVNLARKHAFDVLQDMGFKAYHAGLGMQSPAAAVGVDCATYNRPDALLLCDLR